MVFDHIKVTMFNLLDACSIVQMSNHIRSRKAVTTAQMSPPPTQPSAATAPTQMDHMLVGPGGSPAPASLASSVAQLVSAKHCHRPPSTTDTTSTDSTGASGSQPEEHPGALSAVEDDERHRAVATAELHSSLAHDIGHVVRAHCPMKWKSWKVMPDETRMEVCGQLSTNYNLEDLDDGSLTYVNRLFAERYKQWKSDLHHHFQTFDDSQVALHEGCPQELEGREDSWAWLCGHFQEADYLKKAQANKCNRDKKTLLHHSGSRPFSYRMDSRRREGSKFLDIDVFGDVYVQPGNELAESLHMTMVEKSQLVLQESASQLPPDTLLESVDPPHDARFQILTETLDQTLERRPGTYCRGMGNARRREPRARSSSQSNNQVTTLTAEVVELRTQMSQMSQILQSIVQSGVPIPHVGPSLTSEPLQPELRHHTPAPADTVQTSEPHLQDDHVDFQTLFD
ncbi:unnamed protein product [Prunus armeniaca]